MPKPRLWSRRVAAARRLSGKNCGVPGAMRQGKAGPHPRQSVCGERGNRYRVALVFGWRRRRRAGASSPDDSAAGRSPRSSRRMGKPFTGRRRAASSQWTHWKPRRPPANIGESWPTAAEAVVRVREIQTRLHQWAKHDPNRRFDDLYNLVCDPSFLLMAWRRVNVNRGARSVG